MASGGRTSKLKAVIVPTLVVHGGSDALVNVSGGKATETAIEGSELLIIDDMSHDLTRGVWPQVVDRMTSSPKMPTHDRQA